MPKEYSNSNVYQQAKLRIHEVFKKFPKVYLAFSGGKDSTVMLDIAIRIAKKLGRVPLDVLFIDLEAQYQCTIQHIEAVALNDPAIRLHWVCLPLNLRNSVSVFQPHWRCWDPEEKNNWVRPMPKHKAVISSIDHYPFFKFGMEFEDFVYKWGQWFAGKKSCSCLLGIRANESLHRFISVKRPGWKGKNWLSRSSDYLIFSYPIYDWTTEDIWKYTGKFDIPYNALYDALYRCGLSLHLMRVCQPYGDSQRLGLKFYQLIEPETWNKLLLRVAGANFGAMYSKTALLGRRKVRLPPNTTWKKYCSILLHSMPEISKKHYHQKITIFLQWWSTRGFPIQLIPDQANLQLENTGKIPSWRRICKCLIKNDWWCTSLGFNQTKTTYEKLYKKPESK